MEPRRTIPRLPRPASPNAEVQELDAVDLLFEAPVPAPPRPVVAPPPVIASAPRPTFVPPPLPSARAPIPSAPPRPVVAEIAAAIVAAPIVAAPIVAAPIVAAPIVAAPIVAAPIPVPSPRAAETVVVAAPSAVVTPLRAPSASGSRWTAPIPGHRRWWRYTVVSAGLSALVSLVAIVGLSDPASAAAPAEPAPAPPLVAHEASTVEPAPAPTPLVATTRVEEQRLLARRIALRGTRNLAGGLPRLAREAFEEALRHDPNCRGALAGLGTLDFEAKRHRSAIAHLGAAVRIEPRDAKLQRMLGEAHLAVGHARAAARHLRLAEQHGG